jgi:hypothetical protein
MRRWAGLGAALALAVSVVSGEPWCPVVEDKDDEGISKRLKTVRRLRPTRLRMSPL